MSGVGVTLTRMAVPLQEFHLVRARRVSGRVCESSRTRDAASI